MRQDAALPRAGSAGDVTHVPSPVLPFYVHSVIAIGVGAIVWSLPALLRMPHAIVWMLFTALALLTGRFTMKIASLSANISVTDTFFIASAMFFGPEPATIAVAINTSFVSFRRGHSLERVAFNTAAPALAMWLASHAFFLSAGIEPLAQAPAPLVRLIAPLIVLTAIVLPVQFRVDGAGDRARHAAARRSNLAAALPVALAELPRGRVGGVLPRRPDPAGEPRAAAMVLPLLVIFHLTLRSSFGRLEDAQRHLGDMDRLYLSTVETLAMAIDAKDDVTHDHVRRVQAYAMGLAQGTRRDRRAGRSRRSRRPRCCTIRESWRCPSTS